MEDIELPQVLLVCGRSGYNSDLNGSYELGNYLHDGRVFYINKKNNWVIRWHQSAGLWIIDWRGLQLDAVAAAYVKQSISHPILLTKPWKVYDGDAFIKDNQIQLKRISADDRGDEPSETLDSDTLNMPVIQHTNIPLNDPSLSPDLETNQPLQTPLSNTQPHLEYGTKQSTLEPLSIVNNEHKKRIPVEQQHFTKRTIPEAGATIISSLSSTPSKKLNGKITTNIVQNSVKYEEKNVIQIENQKNETEMKNDSEIGGEWLDEFGFIENTLGTPDELSSPIDPDLLNFDLARQNKWKEMLYGRRGTLEYGQDEESRMYLRNETWKNKIKKNPKLKNRIRKGVPSIFRGEVWAHITGARDLRVNNPNVYKNLLKNLKKTEFEKQLWKDIKRSLRKHIHYQNLGTQSQDSLYRLLTCYIDYHEHVGYNQGISFIAALLLLFMEEEDAFWVLHVLTTSPKFAMQGVWAATMPLIHQRFFQMECLAGSHCSTLQKKLDEMFIKPDMYCATQWFVTVFLATDMPFNVIVRIWDIYLNEGVKVIFRFGLALLYKTQKALPTINDEDFVWEELRSVASKVDESLIEKALKFRITSSQLAQLESDYRNTLCKETVYK